MGEEWLNRIGIGLLLIGVAFLFKYSIDQGCLNPPIRSAIGLGVGMFLFVLVISKVFGIRRRTGIGDNSLGRLCYYPVGVKLSVLWQAAANYSYGNCFSGCRETILVDLSKLQAIWRILLFIGFGTIFLLLGYYGQSHWHDKKE
nr:DUF2339 domain-containing protein [Fodinibius saliphilus]